MPNEDARALEDPAEPLFDTDIVPLGERALRRILGHVVRVGDEAETTYLEIKSDIDLGNKLGIARWRSSSLAPPIVVLRMRLDTFAGTRCW